MVTTVLSAAAVGCSNDLDTKQRVDPYSSFGEVAYREGCQRVAYTGELAQYEAGSRKTVDVSGSLARAVCVQGMPAPADSPDKLKAIQGQKGLLVSTADAILPKDFLHQLETFLEAILPLHDDGTMEKSIQSVANLLDTMYRDPDFTPALARLAIRANYRPTKTAAGLVHTIVEYPSVDDFLGKVLAMIAPGGTAEAEWTQLLTASSKELKTAQPVANPADPERTLHLALNLVLSTNPDLASGTPRPLVARDYRGVAVANAAGGQLMAPFVDMDHDGLADTDAEGRYVDASGALIDVPPPFPQPGATDTAPRDTQGRALTAMGATSTLYQYLDLDSTVIGGLSRETRPLMDPVKDTTLGLVHGTAGLLGPRASQTKMYMDAMGGMIDSITYNGYDTSQSAVLDLLHAFIQILGDPSALDTLAITSQLMSTHESETSRLIKAMFDANDLGKMHPEAAIPATSTVYDDLMPIVTRILRVPGLAEDMITAMQDPHVRGLVPMIARQMRAANQLDFDHTDTGTYRMEPSALDTEVPVDRTKGDTDYNRSLMQRIAHLIHDANGAQFCNKQGADPLLGSGLITYDQCKMFKVDDLALFYVLNMASPSLIKATQNTDRADTTYKKANFCEQVDPGARALMNLPLVGPEDNFISGQLGTGISDFKCLPTPAAMNRSLFLNQSEQTAFMQNTTDPIKCTDGDQFIDVHNKSIFAWETTLPNNPAGKINAAYYNDTFYDAIRPLVDAFAKHDECLAVDGNTGNCTQKQNAAKIFVDILATLHEHWASPKSSYFGHTFQSTDRTKPRYSQPDSIVSYEPLLDAVLGPNGDLVPALIDLSPVLTSLTVGSLNQPALPVLVSTARYLLDPAVAPPGLAYRNGMTSTVQSNGTTPVPQTTPYYLMADAFAHKRAALAALGNTPDAASQAGAWKAATSALVDQMLTVDKTAQGTFQFHNRHFHAVTLILIDFVRGRLTAHNTAMDTDNWVHKKLTQDLTDLLGGPVFAALGDFVAKVESDPDARTQLYNLLQYLVDEAGQDLVFQTALTTLADQVQMFMDDPDLVPVAHVFGAALDPTTQIVPIQLDLIKRARDLDTNKALLTILRNLYQILPSGTYPASDLADVLSEINRTHPGQGGNLDAPDYKTLLGEVRDFLTDEKRGFTRFLEIVKARGPGPGSN